MKWYSFTAAKDATYTFKKDVTAGTVAICVEDSISGAFTQDDFEGTVMEQFLSSHTDALQDFKPEGYSEEEIYYPRSEEIRKLLIQDFPSLDDEQLEYFIERIYSKIYG